MKNKIFTLALVFAVFFTGNLTAQENDSFIKSDDVSYRALACMDGATFEQLPTTPAGAHTSNSVAGDSGYLLAQKMVDFTGAVEAIRFFGLKLFYDGSAWQAMHDADPYEFIIKLYEDEAGLPDTEIEEFVVSLNSVNTGVIYGTTSYLIFYWDFVLTTPISSLPSTFWISVQNTNADAWFLWISQSGGVSGVAHIVSGSWATHAQTGMGICIKGGIPGQTYEITFDAADGEGGEVQTVAEGVVPTPPDVTREGYAFAGWTPEIVAATEDATYTAQWTIYTYEITFDAADGEGGTVLTVNHGEIPTAPTVTRAGHTFMGWTPEIVAATEDATYTAQWEEIPDCIAGEFWTARSAAENNTWTSVTYGNGLFVAVSYGGTNRVMTSPDGITWTARTAAAQNQWTSVTYGNDLFVAVSDEGANQVMTSPDGITWTARTASENSEWKSVTYGNDVFVAVAAYGTNRVMTSLDGITWTARTAAENNPWTSVTYGNDKFVAVANHGTNRVMTSPDGITWTARTAAESNMWISVTYGNDVFVAVAADGTNRVMTSPDGENWTARTAAEANIWRSVTYGDGMFVAVSQTGTNRVMTSPDGITWTTRTAAEANIWRSVTYGDGMFVAVASDGTNRVMTSECAAPALTVTTQAASSITTSTATGHGNITAIGSGNATNRGVIYYPYTNNDKEIGGDDVTNVDEDGDFGTGAFTASLTGLSVNTRYNARAHATNDGDGTKYGSRVDFWTLANVPSAPTVNNPGYTTLDVAINANSNPENTEFAIRVTATGVDQFVQLDGTLGASEVWQTAVTWATKTVTGLSANTQYTFEVKARNGNNVETAYSGTANGTTIECFAGEFWTARSAAAANTWTSVTYGNGLFVAVALNGTNLVMTSPDGIAWIARSAAENQQWTSVTYGNGLFVAVASTLGGVNLVMTSEDGINWTARTATEANPWQSVTYGNGLFVAVASFSASGNYVMTSPDGITWTPRTAAESNSWHSITYGDGLFVAVAQSGTNRVMTSPDGINWTARTAAEANKWRSVTYGDGLFVAVSEDGTNRVITSPDGINWTARTAAAQNQWTSVTYGNGLFVAVAQSGTNRVMTSPDGIDWTARAAAEANMWQSVTYGAGMFVAVTYHGTNRVMTSECAAPALTVTTQAASSITISTATGHGNITAIGSGNATNRGVIYYPYTNTDKEIGGDDVTNVSETGDFGTGAFTASLTGLAVNTRYNARAHATNDGDGLKYGSRVDFWTLANVPSAPTVNGATETTLNVTVNVNGNPTNTEFAIHVTATGVDQFVQANGTLGAGEVWQTAADWGTTTLIGLNTGETYSFKVKARNSDHIETAFGESASGITCANPTDGGTIAASQNICSGTAPAAFTSELLPSGHGGTLEYQWQISTASPTFVDIPGATSETYTHTEPLSQTTWFRRMVRVTCDPVGWASATASNSVQVTVEPTPFSGSLEKHPNDDSVAMGATVSATLTEGSGGNGTDELQYRTHDGTSWTNWQTYTSGNEISSFLKTEIQVRTWREADYCAPAGIVTFGWDVETTSVTNLDEGFVYYFIQDAVNVASPGHTICIGTNTYDEDVDTSGRGGIILQIGCSLGTVTITGTLTLSEDDVLEMELFSDDDYDKFIIEDDAQINGAELKIIVAGGYKPEAGRRFTIFTSPNNPGKFSNPTLIKVNGHHFILSYENNAKNGGYSVVLTAVKQMFKMEIRSVGSDR